MTLADALGVRPGDVVAFIGAGGKTTAMYRVADDLRARGLRVLVTTTTRIFPPEQEDLPLVLEANGERLVAGAAAGLGRASVVAVAAARLADGKLQGVAGEVVAALRAIPAAGAVLVEADGSARLPFKAPADHEPVIPACTTLLVVVAGADALGAPLSPAVAHRPERVADQAGIRMGDPITPGAAARVMVGPANLRGMPPAARLAALLARAGTPGARESAQRLAGLLAARGVSPVVIAELVHAPTFILSHPARSGEGDGAGEGGRGSPPAPGVAGIVLAAGASTRMGRFKLLLPWRGRPVLDHVLRAARLAPLGPRILVLGHEAGAVRAALDLSGFVVRENPHYLAGQSTSLQAGLAAAPARSTGYLFLLGDQPAITASFIEGLVALHRAQPDRILVPTLAGRRSSPVLFPAALRDELLAVTGDQGGRPILDAHPDLLLPIPVDDPTLLLDLDAPADLVET